MRNQIEITKAAPVLNTPDFHVAFGGASGGQIPRDSLGLPSHYEFVALPGMRFEVVDILPRHHHQIYRVSSKNYPMHHLYIDSRFTKPAGTSFSEPLFPSRKELAARMKQLVGTKYVWGGNWSAGIPELLHLYPPKTPIDEETKTLWTFQGVDCSGLLYETTQGLTPRNTSGLIHFAKPVPIAKLSIQKLQARLEPMDLIVYPGHVFFVLDAHLTIESKRERGGVVQRPLSERLEECFREKTGVDVWDPSLDPEKHFVVRRLNFND